MKMFKTIMALVLGAFLLSGTAACTKVPAGNVGVKVYLLGSSKGVDHEVLGPGRYWVGWNQDLYLFPTYTQNYTWAVNSEGGDESIDFGTVEGMNVNSSPNGWYFAYRTVEQYNYIENPTHIGYDYL